MVTPYVDGDAIEIDSLLIGHVSDVLQSEHGCNDYDATAEYAAQLLAEYPSLLLIAHKYAAGTTTDRWLQAIVAYAVTDNTRRGGFTLSGQLV